ncbi:hypothetical protein KEJ27_07810 [Candidatus Bathyarchaeota archaeon]|nr:hypothetical protein [Candidatus Bathyarchaeota archaeon]MBS7617877.1 hypothetical protein [Candidatus Bathyarchaeota archaeon]
MEDRFAPERDFEKEKKFDACMMTQSKSGSIEKLIPTLYFLQHLTTMKTLRRTTVKW